MHALRPRAPSGRTPLLLLACAAIGVAGCASGGGPPAVPPAPASAPGLPLPEPRGPETLGELGDDELVETSGLATSLRDERVLWAINDSGADPVVHAMDLTGRPLGQVRIDARARDWEDLASATLAGMPSLVIPDTGDNGRRHDAATLYLVAEPDVPGATDASGATGSPVEPWASIRFRYEDGPRDVESVAFADDAFWLLSKAAPHGGSPVPGGIYRLDASPATLAAAIEVAARGIEPRTAVARRVGTLREPGATLATRLALALAGVDLNHPTALDIDAVRGVAWVLTYREVLRFDRVGDEPWSEALARPGTSVYAHGLSQAEALAVTPAGLVVLTSEGRRAPLLGLPAR